MKSYVKHLVTTLFALIAVASTAYATWTSTMSGTGPSLTQKGVWYVQEFVMDPAPSGGTKTLQEIQYEWHAYGGTCATYPNGVQVPVLVECAFPSGFEMQLCFKTTSNCVSVSTWEGWYANTAFTGQTFTTSTAKVYLKWRVSGSGALSPYIVGETNYLSVRYTP